MERTDTPEASGKNTGELNFNDFLKLNMFRVGGITEIESNCELFAKYQTIIVINILN